MFVIGHTEKASTLVSYIWNFCPDCNDCFPYVLLPYSNANNLKTNFYIIDLAVPGILLNEEGGFEGTGLQSYVDFMQEYHMSAAGDETFGYDRGFVPTTQLWEKGKLIDMNVYFNDSIAYQNETFVVSQSYYSSTRVKSLNYTNTVLEGLEIPVEEVEGNAEEGYSWNKDAAAKYHQPILEAFLDKYVK